MTDTNKVRIGFVGVGTMGQCAHLRNYVTVPECEVAAIAELRQDTAQEVAARYGVAHVYPSHQEMLAHESLDGIVASQRFTRHGSIVPELLDTGLPVFIEKPIAASIAVGEQIVKAEAKGGAFLMVGYHKRSDPATLRARQEIDALKQSGDLGRMTYVRIAMPPGDWIANGFLDLIQGDDPPADVEPDPQPADMDEETFKLYQSFVNYYIHQVNLMRHLLCEPYQVRHADPSGVLLVGESASGVPCVIEMGAYRTTLDWQESALVAFEHGWIKLDLPAPLAVNRPGRVEIFRDADGAEPQTLVPQLPWVHAMRQQAVHFVRAVKGEMRPMCTAEEALEDLRVAREYTRLRLGH